MSYTERFTEVHELGGVLFPAGRVVGVYNTPWLDMENHHRAEALLFTGVMTQGSTVDMILQEAQDNAGTGAQAILGKAIVQLNQALGDGNDSCIIELRTIEMTQNTPVPYKFIRAQITVANAATEICAAVLRSIPRYPPVPVTAWSQIIP